MCGEEKASIKCKLCGRLVCRRCFDESRGVCKACVLTLCSVCGKRLSVSSCSVCSRLVCDECSREVEPGIRVCKYCLEKGLRRFREPPREVIEGYRRLVEWIQRS